MSESKILDLSKEVFVYLTVAGLAVWIGTIWMSKGEDKLENTCYPIDWTMETVHDVTKGLIGRDPTWTLHTKKFLLSGCYYFFSVMFREGSDEPVGGIRQ
ncbi:MAG: hypothetical protein WAX89_03625 [Alphaproteobacteria bacterium]